MDAQTTKSLLLKCQNHSEELPFFA